MANVTYTKNVTSTGSFSFETGDVKSSSGKISLNLKFSGNVTKSGNKYTVSAIRMEGSTIPDYSSISWTSSGASKMVVEDRSWNWTSLSSGTSIATTTVRTAWTYLGSYATGTSSFTTNYYKHETKTFSLRLGGTCYISRGSDNGLFTLYVNINFSFKGDNDVVVKFTEYNGTTQTPTVSYQGNAAYVITPSPRTSSYDTDASSTYTVNCYYNDGSGFNDSKEIIKQVTTPNNFSGWGTSNYSANKRISVTGNTTFNANYTKGSSTTTWPKGQSVTLPTPSSSELTFKGWFTAASGGNKVNSPYTPTSTTTNLYAHWDARITFDGNGGSSGGVNTYERGSSLGTLPTSTRTNYRFEGWFTAPTGGSQIYSTTKVDKNVTYYAQWKPLYTISYNLNGGSGSYNSETNVLPIDVKPLNNFDDNWKTYENNNVIFDFNGGKVFGSIASNSSTVNHKFKSWKSSADEKEYSINNIYNKQYNYQSNTTMTAQWTLSYSTTATMPYVEKRPGYKFLGWWINNNPKPEDNLYKSNETRTIEHSSKPLTLYAIWEPVKNTLILNFYDKDKELKRYTKQYTIEDENFTIGIPQTNWNPPYKPLDQEYTFLGWSSGDSINTPTQIAEWQSVYGVYKNVTKAPGYNSDLSKSDLNVLTFKPSKYISSQYWGEKNISIPYGTLDSYTGLTSNYYCCWTVSGKYVKVSIDNQNVWKKISVPYVKVGNIWKVIVDTYIKINGEWKKEVGSN